MIYWMHLMFFHYNPMSHEFFMTILSLALDVSTYPVVIPLLSKCYSINILLLCQSCFPCYAHIHIYLLIFCTYMCVGHSQHVVSVESTDVVFR